MALKVTAAVSVAYATIYSAVAAMLLTVFKMSAFYLLIFSAFMQALWSGLSRGFLSTMLVFSNLSLAISSLCRSTSFRLVKGVPGLISVTTTTYPYRDSYLRMNLTIPAWSLEGETGCIWGCSHYLFDKPRSTTTWVWEARNILPIYRLLDSFSIEKALYRVAGIILVLVLTWHLVYPVLVIASLRSWIKLRAAFLYLIGLSRVFLIVALPYTWAVSLKQWKDREVNEWRGVTVKVAEEKPPTMDEQMKILLAKVDALIKEGGKEIRVTGSDYVGAPVKHGLVRVIDPSGKHVGMAFKALIKKRWTLLTADHVALAFSKGDFALVTSGEEAGIKMSAFSFYGKPAAIRAQVADVRGFELNSKDLSYLKGARSWAIQATPGVGSTATVMGYSEGKMVRSYGTIEEALDGMMFSHSASTEAGFSGTPIIVDDKVAGIHIGFKGRFNMALQLDWLVDTAITHEDSERTWMKSRLRAYDDDVVLVDKETPEECEDEVDQYDVYDDHYHARQQGGYYRIDKWEPDFNNQRYRLEEDDDDLEPLEEDDRGTFRRRDPRDYTWESRTERSDFQSVRSQARQASQEPRIGGLPKLAQENRMHKTKLAPRSIYAGQAFSRQLKVERSKQAWAQIQKSGRNIPTSLAGRGYQDLLSTSDAHLDSTLIGLVEVLGLQTASFRTYWSTHLSNLDNTQKRLLLTTWIGIVNTSGYLPFGDRR